ncbi:hypothetical protein F2P81_013795 [Scophthalmus maximus]|uniref:Secreted frizzled-related protein 1 n=1 Tax=Scophthalmus maximus TaxID=52904 RepID=A0A6A4SM87_SCOMX|nr:hypothetical protein F2P81_013795 [Scophthalmus maximus]
MSYVRELRGEETASPSSAAETAVKRIDLIKKFKKAVTLEVSLFVRPCDPRTPLHSPRIVAKRGTMRSTPEASLWRMARLAVTVALVSACRASEYEYLSWKSDAYNGGRSYGKPPQCVDIPEELRLCHNSLGGPHRAAALSGRHLLSFVVSASDKGRPPAGQSRAESEASSSAAPRQRYSPICPPCDNEMKTDTMLEHMCASEFAFKTKIKEVKRENMDRKVILQKRKKMVKPGNLKNKDLKKLVLYLKNGADCPCQQLDNLGNQYLIMGRKVDKQYLLTGIHKWDKSSKEFKKAIKKLKTYKCPAFETVFK